MRNVSQEERVCAVDTCCRGLVLRARECVSPAEALTVHSMVTGPLASGGDRTRDPLHQKRS